MHNRRMRPRAEVDAAYAAAKEAFKIWGRSTPSTRQKHYLTWQMPLKQMLTV